MLNILKEIVSYGLILSSTSNCHDLPISRLLTNNLLGNAMLGFLQGFNKEIDSRVEFAQVHLHVFFLTLNTLWLFIGMEIF